MPISRKVPAAHDACIPHARTPPAALLGNCRLGGQDFPTPYWAVPGDAALYLGDVRACLRRLPARSVQCVVTSPPYFGLRDYGTGTWEGGSADCDHVKRYAADAAKKSMLGPKRGQGISLPDTNAAYKSTARQFAARCLKCGAARIDMQIGAEPSPDCGTGGQAQCGGCFVCSLVGVFREVYRALRDDGTAWLNLGDTFDAGQLLVPARVALALAADGWKLVQDIIWYSPNKMPESVTNRCTKSHEHIFLLAKGDVYYFDAVAIQEPAKSKYRSSDFIPDSTKDRAATAATAATAASANGRSDEVRQQDVNKRDVWVCSTQGYPGAHFATYSPKLITPCILAGTSEHGCCAACGRTYERVVVRTGGVSPGQTGGEYAPPGQSPHSNARDGNNRDRSFTSQRNGLPGSGSTLDGVPAAKETVGWRKVCGCQTQEVVPCVVLDPFVGSGTTCATAIDLGRAGVGIDLSEEYLRDHAVPRVQRSIDGRAARPGTVVLRGPEPTKPRRLRS